MREPDVNVNAAPVLASDGALLAFPVAAGEDRLRAVRRIEQRTGLAVGDRTLRTDEGSLERLQVLPGIAVAGLGTELDEDAVRTAAAAAARAARDSGESLVWAFDEELLTPETQVRAVVEGALLGTHDPARWKTTGAAGAPWSVELGGAPQELVEAARRAAVIARWTNRARELVDAPPNELTPDGLATAARALYAGLPIDVEVLAADAIEEAGLHALAAVGRGSAHDPRLIVLRYQHGAGGGERLGLVGKGVTFDSGGYFLKPQSDIVKQKADMGGAASVIGALGALAELGAEADLIVVVPAAENAIDGAAFRPGDIIPTAAGLTVEITNPDAEGRLLLGEGLWYARRLGATRLIDVATLTGAMRTGMGDMYIGVFANDDDWRARIVAAGNASGDHAWPWPLHRRYHAALVSRLADLRNTSGKGFGYPIFAATFIEQFAGDAIWAHLDIHSAAYLDEPRGYLGIGGTGAGVRMLVELVCPTEGGG